MTPHAPSPLPHAGQVVQTTPLGDHTAIGMDMDATAQRDTVSVGGADVEAAPAKAASLAWFKVPKAMRGMFTSPAVITTDGTPAGAGASPIKASSHRHKGSCDMEMSEFSCSSGSTRSSTYEAPSLLHSRSVSGDAGSGLPPGPYDAPQYSRAARGNGRPL